MDTKKKKKINLKVTARKIIASTVACVFLFNTIFSDVASGVVDISRIRPSDSKLPTLSPWMHLSPEEIAEMGLKGILTQINGPNGINDKLMEEINRYFTPPKDKDGVYRTYDLRRPAVKNNKRIGKRKEGNNWVIPCTLRKGEIYREFEAVVSPDTNIIKMRAPREPQTKKDTTYIYDTTHYEKIRVGDIVALKGRKFRIAGNARGDDESSTKEAIEIGTGKRAWLKFEEVPEESEQEMRKLKLLREIPIENFVQGETLRGKDHNIVNVIDHVEGKSLDEYLKGLNMGHEEYFKGEFPLLLKKIIALARALDKFHKTHHIAKGDIHSDNIIIEEGSGEPFYIDYGIESMKEVDVRNLLIVLLQVVLKAEYDFSGHTLEKFPEIDPDLAEIMAYADSEVIVNARLMYDYVPEAINELLLNLAEDSREPYPSLPEVIQTLLEVSRSLERDTKEVKDIVTLKTPGLSVNFEKMELIRETPPEEDILYGDKEEGVFHHINKAAEDIFGVKAEEVKDRLLMKEVFYEAILCLAENAKDYGVRWRTNFTLHKDDRGFYWIQVTVDQGASSLEAWAKLKETERLFLEAEDKIELLRDAKLRRQKGALSHKGTGLKGIGDLMQHADMFLRYALAENDDVTADLWVKVEPSLLSASAEMLVREKEEEVPQEKLSREDIYAIEKILLGGKLPEDTSWEYTLDTFIRTYWPNIQKAIREGGYTSLEEYYERFSSESTSKEGLKKEATRLFREGRLPAASINDVAEMRSHQSRHTGGEITLYMDYFGQLAKERIQSGRGAEEPIRILLIGPSFFEEAIAVLYQLENLYRRNGWSFDDCPVLFTIKDKDSEVFDLYRSEEMRYPYHRPSSAVREERFGEDYRGYFPKRSFYDRFFVKFDILDLNSESSIEKDLAKEKNKYDMVFANNVSLWLRGEDPDKRVSDYALALLKDEGLFFFGGRKNDRKVFLGPPITPDGFKRAKSDSFFDIYKKSPNQKDKLDQDIEGDGNMSLSEITFEDIKRSLTTITVFLMDNPSKRFKDILHYDDEKLKTMGKTNGDLVEALLLIQRYYSDHRDAFIVTPNSEFLVHKESGKGLLLLGDPDSGKSFTALRFIADPDSGYKEEDPASEWIAGLSGMEVGMFKVDGRVLVFPFFVSKKNIESDALTPPASNIEYKLTSPIELACAVILGYDDKQIENKLEHFDVQDLRGSRVIINGMLVPDSTDPSDARWLEVDRKIKAIFDAAITSDRTEEGSSEGGIPNLTKDQEKKTLIDSVFEGGGAKGVAYGGALDVVAEKGLWFRRIAGTSAGAITASLIAAGYDHKEMRSVIMGTNFNDFKDRKWGFLPTWLNMLFFGGLYWGHYFEKWIDKKFVEKLGFSPRMKDLPIPLTLIASNITDKEMLIINKETAPDLKVSTAVRMSMGIPFFFNVFRWLGSYKDKIKIRRVVDGGLLSNFPLFVLENDGEHGVPVVGFRLHEIAKKKKHKTFWSILLALLKKLPVVDIAANILSTGMDAHDNRHIEDDDWARIVNIPVDVGTTDFDLTPAKKEELMEKGRVATEKVLDKKLTEAERQRVNKENRENALKKARSLLASTGEVDLKALGEEYDLTQAELTELAKEVHPGQGMGLSDDIPLSNADSDFNMEEAIQKTRDAALRVAKEVNARKIKYLILIGRSSHLARELFEKAWEALQLPSNTMPSIYAFSEPEDKELLYFLPNWSYKEKGQKIRAFLEKKSGDSFDDLCKSPIGFLDDISVFGMKFQQLEELWTEAGFSDNHYFTLYASTEQSPELLEQRRVFAGVHDFTGSDDKHLKGVGYLEEDFDFPVNNYFQFIYALRNYAIRKWQEKTPLTDFQDTSSAAEAFRLVVKSIEDFGRENESRRNNELPLMSGIDHTGDAKNGMKIEQEIMRIRREAEDTLGEGDFFHPKTQKAFDEIIALGERCVEQNIALRPVALLLVCVARLFRKHEYAHIIKFFENAKKVTAQMTAPNELSSILRARSCFILYFTARLMDPDSVRRIKNADVDVLSYWVEELYGPDPLLLNPILRPNPEEAVNEISGAATQHMETLINGYADRGDWDKALELLDNLLSVSSSSQQSYRLELPDSPEVAELFKKGDSKLDRRMDKWLELRKRIRNRYTEAENVTAYATALEEARSLLASTGEVDLRVLGKKHNLTKAQLTEIAKEVHPGQGKGKAETIGAENWEEDDEGPTAESVNPIADALMISDILLGRRMGGDILKARLTRTPFNVMITYKCPLNCGHCFAKEALVRGGFKDAEKDALYSVFDQLSGMEEVYLVGSGEPLAYGKKKLFKGNVSSDFLDIVRYAATKVRTVNIVTNAYLVPENIKDAERFFAQFPKNVRWVVSVDEHHQKELAKGEKKSLVKIVKVMEKLAKKDLIATAYNVRLGDKQTLREDILVPFGLEAKYRSENIRNREYAPRTIFVNGIIAEGNAKENEIEGSYEMDMADIHEHAHDPSEFFPFIDPEGNIVLSEHFAFSPEEARMSLAEKHPQYEYEYDGEEERYKAFEKIKQETDDIDPEKELRTFVLGNISEGPIFETIIGRLLLSNYFGGILGFLLKDDNPENSFQPDYINRLTDEEKRRTIRTLICSIIHFRQEDIAKARQTIDSMDLSREGVRDLVFNILFFLSFYSGYPAYLDIRSFSRSCLEDKLKKHKYEHFIPEMDIVLRMLEKRKWQRRRFYKFFSFLSESRYEGRDMEYDRVYKNKDMEYVTVLFPSWIKNPDPDADFHCPVYEFSSANESFEKYIHARGKGSFVIEKSSGLYSGGGIYFEPRKDKKEASRGFFRKYPFGETGIFATQLGAAYDRATGRWYSMRAVPYNGESIIDSLWNADRKSLELDAIESLARFAAMLEKSGLRLKDISLATIDENIGLDGSGEKWLIRDPDILSRGKKGLLPSKAIMKIATWYAYRCHRTEGMPSLARKRLERLTRIQISNIEETFQEAYKEEMASDDTPVIVLPKKPTRKTSKNVDSDTPRLYSFPGMFFDPVFYKGAVTLMAISSFHLVGIVWLGMRTIIHFCDLKYSEHLKKRWDFLLVSGIVFCALEVIAMSLGIIAVVPLAEDRIFNIIRFFIGFVMLLDLWQIVIDVGGKLEPTENLTHFLSYLLPSTFVLRKAKQITGNYYDLIYEINEVLKHPCPAGKKGKRLYKELESHKSGLENQVADIYLLSNFVIRMENGDSNISAREMYDYLLPIPVLKDRINRASRILSKSRKGQTKYIGEKRGLTDAELTELAKEVHPGQGMGLSDDIPLSNTDPDFNIEETFQEAYKEEMASDDTPVIVLPKKPTRKTSRNVDSDTPQMGKNGEVESSEKEKKPHKPGEGSGTPVRNSSEFSSDVDDEGKIHMIDPQVIAAISEILERNMESSIKSLGRFHITPYVVWKALEEMGFDEIENMAIEEFAETLAEKLDVGVSINDRKDRKEAQDRFSKSYGFPIGGNNKVLDAILEAGAVSYEDFELDNGIRRHFGTKIDPVLEALGVEGYVRVTVFLNKDILQSRNAWKKHIVLHELSEAVAQKMSEIDENFAYVTMHANPEIIKLQLLFTYVLGGIDMVKEAVEVQRDLNKTEGLKTEEARLLENIFEDASSERLFDKYKKENPSQPGEGPGGTARNSSEFEHSHVDDDGTLRWKSASSKGKEAGETIYLKIGAMKIATPPDIYEIVGLGSCVAILLYDPDKKIGAIAHSFLPNREKGHSSEDPMRFVDHVIPVMINELRKKGCGASNLVAGIFGGSSFSFEKSFSIGERNIEAARRVLKENNIPIVTEEVGGRDPRKVSFDPHRGEVRVGQHIGKEGRVYQMSRRAPEKPDNTPRLYSFPGMFFDPVFWKRLSSRRLLFLGASIGAGLFLGLLARSIFPEVSLVKSTFWILGSAFVLGMVRKTSSSNSSEKITSHVPLSDYSRNLQGKSRGERKLKRIEYLLDSLEKILEERSLTLDYELLGVLHGYHVYPENIDIFNSKDIVTLELPRSWRNMRNVFWQDLIDYYTENTPRLGFHGVAIEPNIRAARKRIGYANNMLRPDEDDFIVLNTSKEREYTEKELGGESETTRTVEEILSAVPSELKEEFDKKGFTHVRSDQNPFGSKHIVILAEVDRTVTELIERLKESLTEEFERYKFTDQMATDFVAYHFVEAMLLALNDYYQTEQALTCIRKNISKSDLRDSELRALHVGGLAHNNFLDMLLNRSDQKRIRITTEAEGRLLLNTDLVTYPAFMFEDIERILTHIWIEDGKVMVDTDYFFDYVSRIIQEHPGHFRRLMLEKTVWKSRKEPSPPREEEEKKTDKLPDDVSPDMRFFRNRYMFSKLTTEEMERVFKYLAEQGWLGEHAFVPLVVNAVLTGMDVHYSSMKEALNDDSIWGKMLQVREKLKESDPYYAGHSNMIDESGEDETRQWWISPQSEPSQPHSGNDATSAVAWPKEPKGDKPSGIGSGETKKKRGGGQSRRDFLRQLLFIGGVSSVLLSRLSRAEEETTSARPKVLSPSDIHRIKIPSAYDSSVNLTLISYSPGFDRYYEDLLRSIPQEMDVLAVLNEPYIYSFKKLLKRIGRERPVKAVVLETGAMPKLSIWAQDPFVYGEDLATRPLVLLPNKWQKAFGEEEAKWERAYPEKVAGAIGAKLVELPFFVLSGDILSGKAGDRKYVFIGQQTLAMNHALEDGNVPYEIIFQRMRMFFKEKMGADLVMLPSYRIDSDIDTQVTFRGDGRALLGSLKIGLYETFKEIASDLKSYTDHEEVGEIISHMEKLIPLLKEGDEFGTSRALREALNESLPAVGGLLKTMQEKITRGDLTEVLNKLKGYRLDPTHVVGVLDSLERTKNTLGGLGFQVKALPWMGINMAKLTEPAEAPVITYNNVQFLTPGEVHMPVYDGYEAMNRRARKTYEALGYTVREIECTEIAKRGGAIRCSTKRIGFKDRINASNVEDLEDMGYFHTTEGLMFLRNISIALGLGGLFVYFLYQVRKRRQKLIEEETPLSKERDAVPEETDKERIRIMEEIAWMHERHYPTANLTTAETINELGLNLLEWEEGRLAVDTLFNDHDDLERLRKLYEKWKKGDHEGDVHSIEEELGVGAEWLEDLDSYVLLKDGKEAPPIVAMLGQDGKYRVVEGNRRVIAAKIRGEETISAYVGKMPLQGETGEPSEGTKKESKMGLTPLAVSVLVIFSSIALFFWGHGIAEVGLQLLTNAYPWSKLALFLAIFVPAELLGARIAGSPKHNARQFTWRILADIVAGTLINFNISAIFAGVDIYFPSVDTGVHINNFVRAVLAYVCSSPTIALCYGLHVPRIFAKKIARENFPETVKETDERFKWGNQLHRNWVSISTWWRWLTILPNYVYMNVLAPQYRVIGYVVMVAIVLTLVSYIVNLVKKKSHDKADSNSKEEPPAPEEKSNEEDEKPHLGREEGPFAAELREYLEEADASGVIGKLIGRSGLNHVNIYTPMTPLAFILVKQYGVKEGLAIYWKLSSLKLPLWAFVFNYERCLRPMDDWIEFVDPAENHIDAYLSREEVYMLIAFLISKYGADASSLREALEAICRLHSEVKEHRMSLVHRVGPPTERIRKMMQITNSEREEVYYRYSIFETMSGICLKSETVQDLQNMARSVKSAASKDESIWHAASNYKEGEAGIQQDEVEPKGRISYKLKVTALSIGTFIRGLFLTMPQAKRMLEAHYKDLQRLIGLVRIMRNRKGIERKEEKEADLVKMRTELLEEIESYKRKLEGPYAPIHHLRFLMSNPFSRYKFLKLLYGLGAYLRERVRMLEKEVEGNTSENASTVSPSEKLEEYIKSATGKEIVNVRLSSRYMITEVATALREGKVISLNLRGFKERRRRFREIIDSLDKVGATITEMYGEVYRDDFIQMSFLMNAILRNSFVHGNKLNFDLPIFINLKGDATGRVEGLEFYDLAVKGEADRGLRKEASASEIYGLKQDEGFLKIRKYKREHVLDEEGGIIGTRVSYDSDKKIIPPEKEEKRPEWMDLLEEEKDYRWVNGELLKLGDKGIWISGDTAAGKSFLSIKLLEHSPEYEAVSVGSSHLRTVERDGETIVTGKRHSEGSDVILSRLLGKRKVPLTESGTVRVRYVIALDDTYKNQFFNGLEGAEKMGIKVLKLHEYEVGRDWERLMDMIDEFIREDKSSSQEDISKEEALKEGVESVYVLVHPYFALEENSPEDLRVMTERWKEMIDRIASEDSSRLFFVSHTISDADYGFLAGHTNLARFLMKHPLVNNVLRFATIKLVGFSHILPKRLHNKLYQIYLEIKELYEKNMLVPYRLYKTDLKHDVYRKISYLRKYAPDDRRRPLNQMEIELLSYAYEKLTPERIVFRDGSSISILDEDSLNKAFSGFDKEAGRVKIFGMYSSSCCKGVRDIIIKTFGIMPERIKILPYYGLDAYQTHSMAVMGKVKIEVYPGPSEIAEMKEKVKKKEATAPEYAEWFRKRAERHRKIVYSRDDELSKLKDDPSKEEDILKSDNLLAEELLEEVEPALKEKEEVKDDKNMYDAPFLKDKIIVKRNNVPGKSKGQVTLKVKEVREVTQKEAAQLTRSIDRWREAGLYEIVHTGVIGRLEAYFNVLSMGEPYELDETVRIYLALSEADANEVGELEIEGFVEVSTSKVTGERKATLWEIHPLNRSLDKEKWSETRFTTSRGRQAPIDDKRRFEGVGRQLLCYAVNRERKTMGRVFTFSFASYVGHMLEKEGMASQAHYDRPGIDNYIEMRSNTTLRTLEDSARSGDEGSKKLLKEIFHEEEEGYELEEEPLGEYTVTAESPFTYDMLDEEGLASSFADKLLSILAVKKVVLAFEDGLGGANSSYVLDVFDEIKKLKKDPKYKRFLRNLEVITAPSSRLSQEVSEHIDENTEVFVFARTSERKKVKVIEEVTHTTYINEEEHFWNNYYPLAEIVTITLSQHIDPTTLDRVSSLLEELNLSSSMSLNSGVIIFTLLPDAREYDKQSLIKKYAALKRALVAA